MKNILKKHDISLRLLSLLLSVVLWAVVMDMDNPERPRTFDNIPVRISGAAVLQQQTGLSLIEGADSTVNHAARPEQDARRHQGEPDRGVGRYFRPDRGERV